MESPLHFLLDACTSCASYESNIDSISTIPKNTIAKTKAKIANVSKDNRKDVHLVKKR